ncbi:MAG TPA: alpha-2-macroglobulin family protein [Kofleriaceae bacterium]|nr:alpha-2-macroglobulin family protein [Kofleriaceae bacterium]
MSKSHAGSLAVAGAAALVVACHGGGADRDRKAASSSKEAALSAAERAELDALRQRAAEEEKKKKAARDVARGQAQLGMTMEELEEANGNLTIALAEANDGRRPGHRAAPSKVLADDDKDAPPGRDPEDPTRAWFPETFLFEPLVVTDASGAATVPVRVPDRLTTWRVLALGHTRGGAQGGAVTSFLSTLPTYVDVVAPEQLLRGDRVRLPVQLVDTTDAPVATALSVTASNATVSGGGGPRTIPAHGSLVDHLDLAADRPGTIELKVGLRGGDAVAHRITVLPTGKPIVTTRSGTLAAPRTLSITGPAGSDPATDRVRLQAFPGALALLRQELAVCTARGGVADDAYALYLGGRATALLAALGGQADADSLGDLAMLTTQRAVRDARTLDLEPATLLTEAALAHADSPVLARLGERAAAYLAGAQRPDGTFGGGDGWTLQRVLVATADATRAVGSATGTPAAASRAQAVAIRASGVFERYDAQIVDGYTAAAIVVSGAVPAPQAERLRAKVREAITADATDPDAGRYLAVPAGVVRSDGVAPSRAEATALAALALADDPGSATIVADLGATLLGAYDPNLGWGDGRANLVAMRAVVQLFKTPIASPVHILLTMDGTPIASGTLAADQVKDVLTLDAAAPGLAGPHAWKVVADPPVPGLGYALALESWVPWPTDERAEGLELSAPPAIAGKVGAPVDVALHAAAPSGLPLTVRYALPAGVQADTPTLQALVDAKKVTRFVVAADAIELDVPPLEPGAVFEATLRLVPTLAGTLHTSASSIRGGATTVHVPPATWTIE